MPTRNLFLYTLTVFIWGSTWLGIKFQLGHVDPLVSVVYRFCLATALLFAWCGLRGLKMRFTLRDHLFIALQGACLFGVNYWLVYLAEVHLTSGIVAVVFSTIVFWNILNGRIFLSAPIRGNVVAGAVLGIMGIGLVFWPELSEFSLDDAGFKGFLLSVTATLMASLGNILSARNQRHGLPVVQTNAYGMAYGVLSLLAAAMVAGKHFGFDPSPTYILSLVYLALFGSVVAFGCYLTLVGRIGADRAAYASLLFPIVALAISTLFEDYRWSLPAVTGVAVILAGNALSLAKLDLPALRMRLFRKTCRPLKAK
ncbi:EamA family transporter [uncultured Desulfosarcina sp.]|uniref:DMT family transporter n=1 Tax=uncultured Desulfosarcina sp. TaxID=218289 RepID=UPI0029C7CBE5|nr:EamA family transporter [uncultured Desulfosarcina sp.]